MKLSELMKPCLLANSAPDRPPTAAPIANAHSLNRNVGTPMISAASSSSRIATQARPTRLRSRFRTPNTIRMITVSAEPVVRLARRSPRRAACRPAYVPGGCGIGGMPRWPCRMPSLLAATIRIISAKPSVTIAR